MIATYVELLSAVGTPVERALSRVNLDTDIVGRGRGYMPCRSLCAFVDHAGRTQGIDEIGSRAIHLVGVGALQGSAIARITESPTLLVGLRRLCELARGESSRVSLWLEESEQDLHLFHRGSLPRDEPGQLPMTWWGLGVMVAVIRLFLGPSWMPARMGVPAQGPAGPFTRALYPNTRMVAEPEQAWIAVSRSELSAPARSSFSPLLPPAMVLEEPPDGFIESLRQVLRLYMPGGLPGLNSAAEVVGSSVRTLQRRLRDNKRTYSQLAEEVRFEFARDQLAVPRMKVIDVAYDAGYNDPSHFARAFRRIAGVSPREYQRFVSQAS